MWKKIQSTALGMMWVTNNLIRCHRYRHLALTTNQRRHFATASRRMPSWTCRSWEGRRTQRTWHLSGSGRPTAGSAQTSALWWCSWRQQRPASEPSWTSAARLHTRYVIDWVVVLCPTRKNWSLRTCFPQANLLAWRGIKTKPNTTKARIHQSKETNYNTK